MSSNADHVVLSEGAFHCKHCGDRYPMQLPCDLGVLAGASRSYVARHRNCAAKKVEPVSDPSPQDV